MQYILTVSQLMDLECPLCFWLDRKGLSPPFHPLPGILSRMDSVIKRYMEQFTGSAKSPDWFPVDVQRFIGCRKLEAKDPGSGITLRGIPDAIAIGKDGMCYVVDYKTAAPRAEAPSYYQLQLDAYAWLLEANDFQPVGGAYLLYFSPLEGDISEKLFPFQIAAVRVKVDPSKIPPLLDQARRILEMETPPDPDPECEWCRWRQQTREFLDSFQTPRRK